MIPPTIRETVSQCARGPYQESLLSGHARWSGADLKGKASSYGASYHRSRAALLARIRRSLPDGWTAYTDTSGPRGQRVLYLASPDGPAVAWRDDR